MSGKSKNFTQAIDDIEDLGTDSKENGNGDFRRRIFAELHNLEETLEKIKPHLEGIRTRVEGEAKRAKDTVEDQVQKNPWAAIGIVGLVFFLLGFLLSGRRRD